jgi:hypothetical protein
VPRYSPELVLLCRLKMPPLVWVFLRFSSSFQLL